MGLEKSWNNDVALASLQPPASFPELYEPLWWYSGGQVALSSTSSAGQNLLRKGATSFNPSSSVDTHLFTISSAWPSSQQYAFEINAQNASGYTGYAELWDITAGTGVSASQVTLTATTATTVRSGQFTLTPGHTYGVTIWHAGSVTYVTDASLIVFPSSPLVSPSLSAVSLANPSGNTLKESYIPLWVYSSGSQAGNYRSAGQAFIQKGTASSIATSATGAAILLPLSSGWKSTQSFAFEASIQATSGYTAYLALWDATSNAIVSSSQITTTSTTLTVTRSGSFTLTPGHSYAVTGWSPGSGTFTLSKAHLVALA